MTPETPNPIIPRPTRPLLLKVVASGLIAGMSASLAGCARDRASITPTTTGTDFSRVPPGRMVPQPFPGSSLADNEKVAPRGRIAPDAPILTSGSSDAIRR
jgi:hypothetical protein